jgi:aspartate-semialdehyde dehydrogenase
MERYRVGILGSTGLVGQRLIERLAGHPWFETVGLGASERSAGRPYGEAASWTLASTPPVDLAARPVRACTVEAFEDCDLMFSALDRDVAERVEPEFADAGFAVVSNSSAFRQAVDVPLIVPEINPDHLYLLDAQRRRTGGGFIVTNPNCSTTGLAVALAPLHRAFGVERLVVATLQAISGAGTSGPRGIELLDNVLPWIPGEEEKIEQELARLLGAVGDDGIIRAELSASAHCHRVPTLDGHLEAVSVGLRDAATIDGVVETLRGWRGEVAPLGLPSAPDSPIVVRAEPDRPQPRLDREAGDGMSVVVGRVRPCPVLDVRLVVLSHNAVRGAAGGTLLNAELLAARELLPRRSRT